MLAEINQFLRQAEVINVLFIIAFVLVFVVFRQSLRKK